jgi:pimeloyl-ACP methyl ester carboxylesterase
VRAPLGVVEIEYEVMGDDDGEPLLLIGGLGSQLISWDEEFCEELVARGYRVVRYDNRDSGLSTALDGYGVPDLLGLVMGRGQPPYLLDALAEDAAALLRYIGVAQAHVIGLSLGGMVAQLLALAHPEMVLSVVAALSGPPGRPSALPAPDVVRALLRPPAETFGERVEAAVALRQVLAVHEVGFDAALASRRAELQIRRAYSPAATMRQAAAVLGTPNRLEDLHRLSVPVLFVHGELDPLVPLMSAQAAAAVIPRAELITMPRLGHDLPAAVAMGLIDRITDFHARHCDGKDGAA